MGPDNELRRKLLKAAVIIPAGAAAGALLNACGGEPATVSGEETKDWPKRDIPRDGGMTLIYRGSFHPQTDVGLLALIIRPHPKFPIALLGGVFDPITTKPKISNRSWLLGLQEVPDYFTPVPVKAQSTPNIPEREIQPFLEETSGLAKQAGQLVAEKEGRVDDLTKGVFTTYYPLSNSGHPYTMIMNQGTVDYQGSPNPLIYFKDRFLFK